MSKLAKFFLSLSVFTVLTSASSMWQVAEAAKPQTVTCTIDIVNTIHSNSSTSVPTESYQRTIVLTEGVPYSEDYSTFTRFKFFDAALTRDANGTLVVAINWFADVSVFNSVDLTTAVKIPKGTKTNESAGSHEYDFSGGFNSTTYSIVAVRD